MERSEIISKLPYSDPFLFVDEIEEVNAYGIRGNYTFKENSEFYRGHFKSNPITPGVILIEVMVQIGLVSFGIYLNENSLGNEVLKIAFTESKAEFLLPVFPGEKVTAISNKIYYRFDKLKCEVKLYNQKDELVCRGEFAGMILKTIDK